MAEAAEDLLNLENFLCFSIYATNHAFGRVYKPLLGEMGLTYPQYLVLVVLWQKDGQTVGEIGERLFLESNTLTPLLKRLVAAGLLQRTRDLVDERQVRIHLTDAGRLLRSKAAEVPRCIASAAGLNLSEIDRLNGQITKLRKSLDRVSGAE